MSLVDSAMTREVLRDISKRPVDIADLDVHVMHGVVYLRGNIAKIRGYYGELDLQTELNLIVKFLKQKTGIRDVVCEVSASGPRISERMDPRKKHTR